MTETISSPKGCKQLNLFSVIGYYMYTEASSPRVPGDTAKLNSPRLRFSGDTCLQFYYHMYGADMGTFNVYIDGIKVFSQSGPKGDKWLKAEVDVNLWGIYVVRNTIHSFKRATKDKLQ